MKIYILFILSLLTLSNIAIAEDDIFAVDDLFAADNSGTSVQNKTEPASYLSSFISSRLPEATARNILKAEKIFCYTVEYAPADFDGYMINDLKIKGSCGEVSATGKELLRNALFNNGSAFSSSMDNCNINPKIMIRYVYGVDYTDVLISTPCHSLTFFHNRDINTINAAPGAEIINKIVAAYNSLNEDFISPALMGQMVANGQVMTQKQKDILRRQSLSEAPKRKWGNETNSQKTQPTAESKPKTGWNKLK